MSNHSPTLDESFFLTNATYSNLDSPGSQKPLADVFDIRRMFAGPGEQPNTRESAFHLEYKKNLANQYIRARGKIIFAFFFYGSVRLAHFPLLTL